MPGDLVARARGLVGGSRRLLGITGPPGGPPLPDPRRADVLTRRLVRRRR